MKEDVVCVHVPVVSMVLAVFMSQFLWLLLSVAHVYIPLPVWLGSFLGMKRMEREREGFGWGKNIHLVLSSGLSRCSVPANNIRHCGR
jgi:hypothetical protein